MILYDVLIQSIINGKVLDPNTLKRSSMFCQYPQKGTTLFDHFCASGEKFCLSVERNIIMTQLLHIMNENEMIYGFSSITFHWRNF